MEIIGTFTNDEIESAKKHAAEVTKVAGGNTSLKFSDEYNYSLWKKEQYTNHPNRWSTIINIIKSQK